jgi:hypothetical protein
LSPVLATKTEVMVLTVKCASHATKPDADQRRHRRFLAGLVDARAAAVEIREPDVRVRSCSLSNLSYGGMCFSTDAPLVQGAEHHFLIHLARPFGDLILVRARLVWTGVDEAGRQQAGAEFLESSKGWLGPGDA